MQDMHCTDAESDCMVMVQAPGVMRGSEVLREQTLNYHRFGGADAMINPVYTLTATEYATAASLVFWARRVFCRRRIKARKANTWDLEKVLADLGETTKKPVKKAAVSKKKKKSRRGPKTLTKSAPVPPHAHKTGPILDFPMQQTVAADDWKVIDRSGGLLPEPVVVAVLAPVVAPPLLLNTSKADEFERLVAKKGAAEQGCGPSKRTVVSWKRVLIEFMKSGRLAMASKAGDRRRCHKQTVALVVGAQRVFMDEYTKRGEWRGRGQVAIDETAAWFYIMHYGRALGAAKVAAIVRAAQVTKPVVVPPPEQQQKAQPAVLQQVWRAHPLSAMVYQLEYFLVHNRHRDPYLQQFVGMHGVVPYEVLMTFPSLVNLALPLGVHPMTAMVDAAKISPMLIPWTTGISAVPMQL
jgi:hypothetical protein